MACFVELTLIEINNMEVIGPIVVNFTKVKYFRGFDEDGYSITRIVFKDVGADNEDVFVQA
jgi:hypothetical protein